MSTKARKSIFKAKRKPARKVRLRGRGGEAIIDMEPMRVDKNVVYMPEYEAEALRWHRALRVIGWGMKDGIQQAVECARANPLACVGLGLFAAGALVTRAR